MGIFFPDLVDGILSESVAWQKTKNFLSMALLNSLGPEFFFDYQ